MMNLLHFHVNLQWKILAALNRIPLCSSRSTLSFTRWCYVGRAQQEDVKLVNAQQSHAAELKFVTVTNVSNHI